VLTAVIWKRENQTEMYFLKQSNLLLKDVTFIIIQDVCRHKRVSYYVRMKPESVKLTYVHFIGVANRFLS